MKRERQAILSLVALGRITPREAERLLAASNAGREELWGLGVCAGACIAQSLPGLAHMLLPGGIPGLLHAVLAMTYGMGGML